MELDHCRAVTAAGPDSEDTYRQTPDGVDREGVKLAVAHDCVSGSMAKMRKCWWERREMEGQAG
jgi:hypothetical protein